MIIYKSREQIELIKMSGDLLGRCQGLIGEKLKENITTKQLDKIAEEFIRDNGGVPAFKGYKGYPYTLCISINDVVVHGLPSDYVPQNGDIVSIDCGVSYQGMISDSAYTYEIGEVSEEVKRLLRVTKESLYKGISVISKGSRVQDIGYAIQTYVEKNGFNVVRELVGHGVGVHVHEKPEIPNYGKRGCGPRLMDGMVIAIEPMVNMGVKDVYQDEDGWSIKTKDKKPSAHFEHTVAIVDGKAEVLTTFKYIEKEN
jgi:methionyl aminopeptidase